MSWGGARSAAGPTLPHAELEDREIGSLQKRARRNHDFGRADGVAIAERQIITASFLLRRIALAHGGHQRLESLRGQRVCAAFPKPALDGGCELRRLLRSAAVRRGLGRLSSNFCDRLSRGSRCRAPN